MAEILLSLTIIGVVAAITLPSLTGNINERTWNTQRKALYARFSQAISLMPSLNGYGNLTAEQIDAEGNLTQSAVDTAAETFITEGLSKVLKINNICDSEHLDDCGLPDKILPYSVNFSASSLTNIKLEDIKTAGSYNTLFTDSRNNNVTMDIKAAAFETANGESILTYYNPYCLSEQGKLAYQPSTPFICANFLYDLNGKKGPNTMGKDIGFITAIYPSDSVVVAPVLDNKHLAGGFVDDAGKRCMSKNNEYRLPNREELMAMAFNRILIGRDSGSLLSSTRAVIDGNQKIWLIYFEDAWMSPEPIDYATHALCIIR